MRLTTLSMLHTTFKKFIFDEFRTYIGVLQNFGTKLIMGFTSFDNHVYYRNHIFIDISMD